MVIKIKKKLTTTYKNTMVSGSVLELLDKFGMSLNGSIVRD